MQPPMITAGKTSGTDKKEWIYTIILMKCVCVVGLIWTERDNTSCCRPLINKTIKKEDMKMKLASFFVDNKHEIKEGVYLSIYMLNKITITASSFN